MFNFCRQWLIGADFWDTDVIMKTTEVSDVSVTYNSNQLYIIVPIIFPTVGIIICIQLILLFLSKYSLNTWRFLIFCYPAHGHITVL